MSKFIEVTDGMGVKNIVNTNRICGVNALEKDEAETVKENEQFTKDIACVVAMKVPHGGYVDHYIVEQYDIIKAMLM